MDHRKRSITIILLMAVTILSGCAAPPQVTSAEDLDPLVCPTVGPQDCPDALPQTCPTSETQECPTSAIQPQAMNQWRWGYTKDLADFIITFDPGDKCSLELIRPVEGNELAYDIVVNDQTYENYVVAILSLEEGKGIKDLEAYTKEGEASHQSPPPWSAVEGMEIVQPMSRTFHAVRAISSPLYFVCLVQGPDDQRVIEELDGIPIPGN